MFTKKQLRIELIKVLGRALISVVLAAIGIYIFSGQIAKIGQTAKENRTAVAILEQNNQVANELKNDFVLIGGGDEKIEDAFIKAENIVEFINKLERIAKDNNLEQTLRFGMPAMLMEETEGNEAAKALKLMKVEYNIALKGNATSFNNYLQKFEELPYFSNIISITMNSNPANGWEKEATINVRAQLYLRQ